MKPGRIISSSLIIAVSAFMANFANKFIYLYNENRNTGNLTNLDKPFGFPLKACETAVNSTTENLSFFMRCDSFKYWLNLVLWLLVFASIMFFIYWLIIQFMRRLNGF